MAAYRKQKSFRRRFGNFLCGLNPAMANRVRRFRSRFPRPGLLPLAERQSMFIVSRLVGLFNLLLGQTKARRLSVASGKSTRFTPRVEALEARQMLTALYVAPVWTVVAPSSPVGSHSPAAGDHVQYTAVGHDTVSGIYAGVPTSTAFPAIGAAVSAANSGDTVQVIQGTYTGSTPVTPAVSSVTVENYTNTNQIINTPDTVTFNDAGGAFVINTTSVSISGLTISSNSGTAIAVQSGGTSYSISGDTLQSSSVGVSADATGSISGNMFSGDSTGIQTLGGTDTISGNTINGGALGIQVNGGTASISTTTFGTGPLKNTTDLRFDSGSLTLGGGNSFAGVTYIDNQTAQEVNATGAGTFGGVNASLGGTTLAQEYAIVDQISDGITYAGQGLVRLRANEVFVTQLAETTNAGAIQRAVNLASANDTVYVQAGHYVDNVTISQPVHLLAQVRRPQPYTRPTRTLACRILTTDRPCAAAR